MITLLLFESGHENRSFFKSPTAALRIPAVQKGMDARLPKFPGRDPPFFLCTSNSEGRGERSTTIPFQRLSYT
jgi:hypothetical protein